MQLITPPLLSISQIQTLKIQPIKNIDSIEQIERVASDLQQGKFRLLRGISYHNAVKILQVLKQLCNPPQQHAPFHKIQQFKIQYRQAASHLLCRIENYEVQLSHVPKMGLLTDLYPEQPDFLLAFIYVQEIYAANEKYEKGQHFASLGYALHPFYGTYAPTRIEHIELFTTWLSQYKGPLNQAIDVGCGCGILSFLLIKKGFQQVWATDNNPNAIESIKRDAQRQKIDNLQCRYGNFLVDSPSNMDLIICNPPWIPGKANSLVDQGLYFDEDFFPHFFEQAHAKLAQNGDLLLIFSNIMTLLTPNISHPFEVELQRNRFVLHQKMQRKIKPKNPGQKTKEKVEIWHFRRK